MNDRADPAAHGGSSTDWRAWHDAYDDETSELSRRLRIVRGQIDRWLTRSAGRVRVVSACAGQGRDLIGVLAGRPDAGRVQATLIEYDPRNVAVARAAAERAGLSNLTVRQADAGRLASYVGAVPADLVLMVGVLGNITDADVRRTVLSLPQLCAEGGTVIWTRTREAPDLTPAVRGWFRDSGFAQEAFHAPEGALFSVGVHRLAGRPRSLDESGTIFSFVR
ncbi:class I SAM-dependent methyltransferase family protein [Plantactinospora sp. GCM10030261]|uniref:class I SAM-dependent methyltransferase family protein n=1 Tax=Plantactinospora sp. GCM10030261 TaxID=3273420 RepID=UPI003617D0AD